MNILNRFRATYQTYPRQFWLMFVGMLISTIGTSMIWPFLMIYVTERSSASLTAASSLMTVHSVMALLTSVLAGSFADRFGRKWLMVISLGMHGINYLLLSQANHLTTFAILLALQGAVAPLYRVGSDAMMADLVPEEKRVNAYALLRLSNNLGISLGPTIGGFVVTQSYQLTFILASAGLAIYALMIAVFASETLPVRVPGITNIQKEPLGGYSQVIKDVPFILFVATFSLVSICATLIWILMPVYAKQQFSVPERLYGLIPTTNALMVVLLQLLVTSLTHKYPTLLVTAVGAAFYSAGVTSVAWSTGFNGFWISMVIMTIGELIIVPTSSTYVANLAPRHMRGRYMSVYGLTWGISAGIGPLFGGILSDSMGPAAPWYGGGLAGAISVVSFIFMYQKLHKSAAHNTARE